ncbi:MAG: chloride channel protein [Actinobacteria bacterium]|nr:chloride channel protein [Actinomycetota bacterium]
MWSARKRSPRIPRTPRPSERLRIPQPLIRTRLPSGRGATEQPNVTSDGDTALTPVFWMVLVGTGVAAGLFGDLLMFILYSVEHLAFGFNAGPLTEGVRHASDLRRLIVLPLAGLIGGVAWYLLRRYTSGKSEIDDSIWNGDGKLAFLRSFGTSVISEVVIGMGASLGREAAPKLMGGVSASVLATWTQLSVGQRRLLVACGGGAGLAAVYNVPLAGALFTAEVMVGTLALPVVLPALACSGIATAVAWIYLPAHATYLGIPAYHFTAPLLVWSLIAGPVIGAIAAGYIRLLGWVSFYRFTGWRSIPAMVIAFTILGLIGFGLPELFGNGRDMANQAFLGIGGFGLLLGLFLLKPLVTALCLGSGATGGLFTPTFSTGAVFGAAFGIAWSMLWPGSPAGAYALVGAAAFLGASMQAPLASLALALELTHSGFQIMVPMLAATVTATIVSRYIDGYSIYSARLPPQRGGPVRRARPPGRPEPHTDTEGLDTA